MITDSDIKYVIVQAGGKGTRMGRFAENKPKCLVPVNDIPIIVNTLNVYKDKKVIIIADYLSNVLETYLDVFYDEIGPKHHIRREDIPIQGKRSS